MSRVRRNGRVSGREGAERRQGGPPTYMVVIHLHGDQPRLPRIRAAGHERTIAWQRDRRAVIPSNFHWRHVQSPLVPDPVVRVDLRQRLDIP